MGTKIEWCDHTVNPVKGLCPMACTYCYARRMYKRFGWNEDIAFEPAKTVAALNKIKTPSRIFVGSTMELFGNWVPSAAQRWIFKSLPVLYPQHTFIFLTKQPQNLCNWSPFPKNVHVGFSATDTWMFQKGITYLRDITATVKFISFEPLLHWESGGNGLEGYLTARNVNWIILGQHTPVQPSTEPKLDWIREIVQQANKYAIPVFLKDNLYPLIHTEMLVRDRKLFRAEFGLRQEFPKGVA